MLKYSNPLVMKKAAGKGKRTQWLSPLNGQPKLVEDAAADYFRSLGRYASHDYTAILNAALFSTMFKTFKASDKDDARLLEDLILGGVKTKAWVMEQRERRASIGMAGGNLEDHEDRLQEAKCRSDDEIKENLKKILPKVIKARVNDRSMVSRLSKQELQREFFGVELSNVEQLAAASTLVDVMGVERLLGYGRVVARDRGVKTGLPDILIWSKSEFLFLEVKSPSDRLSSAQKAKIASLEAVGITCDVLSVMES